MLFHSYAYAVLFSITLVVYWSLRSTRLRTAWLVVASLVFYSQWSVRLTGLILFVIVFDYLIARYIEGSESPKNRKRLLISSLVASLGLLVYFKYGPFIVETAWRAAGLMAPLPPPPIMTAILPLGISFYTFETISYVVDVYRGRTRAEPKPLNYALFLLFFPHLIAGPIVRAGHFLPQIDRPKRFSWPRMALGAHLFVRGLLKKAVVADQLALIVDPVFATPAVHATTALWLAAACYAVQLYCDFSGYSDMAIGSAHALGFKLPVNFDRPYLAENIAEFWRRWHITLASWLRDYVYLPLGGSREGPRRTARNLLITLFLAGLWHGAGIHFAIFGLVHGLWLAIYHGVRWPAWTGHRVLRPARIGLTTGLFAMSLVIFRVPSTAQAFRMLGRMMAPAAGLMPSAQQQMFLVTMLAFLWLAHGLSARPAWRRATAPWPIGALGVGLGFVLAQLLVPSTAPAFIYFQF